MDLGRTAFDLVRDNAVAKGDVLSVAQVLSDAIYLMSTGSFRFECDSDHFCDFQISGIMGAKRTSDLIPLCHPLPLSLVDVRLRLDEAAAAVEVSC